MDRAPGNFAGDLAWHVKNLIVGAPRNWARNVLEWNLAADPDQNPHTEGGCTECLGAVTIDGNTVTRNPAYYIIAHASKFVRPGSVRIASNVPASLPAIGCGDLMWDKFELFEEYKQAVATTGVPFFQVIGNHDIDIDARTDELSGETFKKLFGPTYYSFNRGEIRTMSSLSETRRSTLAT